MSDDAVTPEDVLSRIAGSPYASLLHDEHALRGSLAELMAGSPDPILAEMGQALAAGEIDWGGLARVEAYRGVLDRGLAALGSIDLAEVVAGLDAERAAGWPGDHPRRTG